MTSAARRVLRDLTPPLVSRAAGRRSRHQTRFVDGFDSWSAAVSASPGYSESSILDTVLAATLEVEAGRAAFERDGVAFATMEYRWPVLGGLLRQAAMDRGALHVLDFGGSLGSSYRQYTGLLGDLDLRWGVVEQPEYVDAGRRFENGQLSFHDSVSDCAAAVSPNVALFSSVLQYLETPFAVLDEVAAAGVSTIVIDRTPTTDADHDIPSVQVVPSSIYTARYPAWLFGRERLVSHLGGWRLVDTFPGIEPDVRTSGGVQVKWLGMTLSRT